MKTILSIFAVTMIGLSLGSCSKKCTSQNAACNDTVPTNEECLAVFERWFYNPNTKNCELQAYSGCSQKGFATEAECNTCKCKND